MIRFLWEEGEGPERPEIMKWSSMCLAKTHIHEIGKKILAKEVPVEDSLEDLRTIRDEAFLDYHCLHSR